MIGHSIEDSATPSISVVLPVYNARKYVLDAIRSILTQSFTDFELIIIDDGSNDGTCDVVADYQHFDSRIILVSRENRGLVASLNEGIDLARGTWLARMDADDISLPQRFARQIRCLEETGADICGTWARLFGTADSRILKHAISDSAIKMEMLFGTPFVHPSVMMRASLARDLRYDPLWEKAEDYDLWARSAMAGWRMANVPEVLLMYRQHQAQTSSVAATRQHELTQAVRARYWSSVIGPMGWGSDDVNEILKLRDVVPHAFDMDKIDHVFGALLEQSAGEPREVVFDHMTRLYFRAAGKCPDISARWARLSRRFGNGCGLKTRIVLTMLSALRIKADGQLFEKLKRLFFLIRSSIRDGIARK